MWKVLRNYFCWLYHDGGTPTLSCEQTLTPDLLEAVKAPCKQFVRFVAPDYSFFFLANLQIYQRKTRG
jgi:hypothetical protein